MEKTKPTYLKEILKTTAKVALLAGATAALGSFSFVFGAVYFDTMIVGYLAGGAVLAAGATTTVKTLVQDCVSMPSRVAQQKEKAQMDQRIENVQQRLTQVEQAQQKPLTQEKGQKPKFLARHQMPFLARSYRQKQYGEKQYGDAA